MILRIRLFGVALLMSVYATGCGAEAELGEECEEQGATDGECVDGGVCGTSGEEGTALTCLTICTEQADCPDTWECNGVSGSSVKGCRPKDDVTKK